MMEPVEVDRHKAREIINASSPAGLFYYVNVAGAYVGIDTRGAKPVVRVLGKKAWLDKWMKERV